jgi:hypothetical protein
MGFHFYKKISICIIPFIWLLLSFSCFAQTQKRNQFENTYEFNKVVGKKTSLELDLSHTFTSGTNETNPFDKNSQVSGLLWLHYQASKRWKISGYFLFKVSITLLEKIMC